MRRRTLIAVFVSLLGGAVAAGAAPPGAGSAYLSARAALPCPPLTEGALGSAQQRPADFLGRTLEVTAIVGGLVTMGDAQTALLTVAGGRVSLPVRVGSSTQEASWLNAGMRVRALIMVERTGNDLTLSNLTLLRAAPEGDVAYAERQWASRGASPSRSLAYGTTRTEDMAAAYPVVGTPLSGLSARALAVYAPYRAAVQGMNPRLASGDVDKITSSILYFSDHSDIDPRLVMAMVIAESGFNLYSTSRTGAMGLGQLMPGTARGLGVTDAYDPIQNIAASVHLLRGHLDNYGGAPAGAGIIPFDQIALTMAAYNAGPGAVRKYHGVPPYRETRRYVARVSALYKRMCGLGD